MVSEFVLLTSLIAGVTFGVAAVIGTAVEHPMESLAGLIGGLTGF